MRAPAVRSHLHRLVATIAALAAGSAHAVEMEVDPNSVVGKLKVEARPAEPEVAAASDEGLLAVKHFKLPPGLSVSLWAAEPMLANPVAFNFDERGRAFVSETHRYRTSVLDIRDYMWLLEDELANRNQDEFRAMVLRRFGPAGVAELKKETEIVRVIADTQGTGHADFSAVYADNFRTEIDGIASGVLAHRGAVYFTNIPSVWKFTGDTKAETRTELSTGYGLRFNFTGHDLHGLEIGPDGKLYFSVGDRGAHVTTREGKVLDAADNGAVFRCDLDGSNLELFATGLRNPQDLLFTETGDLFTGDNDSDQGDMERLVHLVEGGDSGWRIGYQHNPMGKAGPWNRELLWLPRAPGQPAYLLAPICNLEDGPSGIAYYPGTGLSPEYAGNMFITTFRGSIARSGILTYKVKPRGASYEIAEAKPFLSGALPTDVKFSPDGRLYWSDWAEGWPKSRRGRLYAVSSDAHVNDPIVAETQKLIAADHTQQSVGELITLLGHADYRVRLAAQFELADRGRTGLNAFTQVVTKTDAAPLARRHALWGLGQLAGKQPNAAALIRQSILDADSEIRAQSAKLLGAHPTADAFGALTAALHDQEPRVRFFAAQSLGKLARPDAAAPLLALLKENDDRDNYLRHAAVVALAASGNMPALLEAARSPSPAVRLGVVLVLRRLRSPEIARFLDDSLPEIVRETALAINDAPIDASTPALAAFLAKPIADEAVMLRAINAAFRLGTPAQAAALAAFAARTEASAVLRAEALTQLSLWPAPPARDRIVGIFRPLPEKTRDRQVAGSALTPRLPSLLISGTPAAVQNAALAAIQKLELTASADALFAFFEDPSQPAPVRAKALDLLERFKDPRVPAATKTAGQSSESELRLAALPIAARLAPDDAEPVLTALVANGSRNERRAALKALAPLVHPGVDAFFQEQLTRLADGKVDPAIQLELLDAAAQRSAPEVKKLLDARTAALAASTDPLAPYRETLAGGDAPAGAKIFSSQPVMACVKCHALNGEGGAAGPDLASVGVNNTREYLLESLIKPNARIAPGFDTVVVTLKNGTVSAGTIAKETDTTLTLNPIEGKPIEVTKADIARRDTAPSSMPEIYGTILSKTELRDMVEFLATQKARPPQKPAEEQALRALRDIRAELAAKPLP